MKKKEGNDPHAYKKKHFLAYLRKVKKLSEEEVQKRFKKAFN